MQPYGATTEPLPPPPAEVEPSESSSPGRRLSAPLALAGASLIGVGYLLTHNPNVGTSIYPQCPLKFLTGLDCPGCGLTRGLYSLLHGNIVDAISHNLLLLFVVPWAIVAFARWTASQLGYTIPRLFEVRPWMVRAMIIGLIAFTVSRNLPYEPFHFLNSA